jgi:RNA polymerase sigma factor (sigma-70 family)
VAALADWNQALAALIHLRGAALKRYGYLLCGDHAEAEDLLQDALVRTFAFARYSDVGQAEQYVRKVMLNLHLDRARRRRLWHRLMPLVAAPEHTISHEGTDLRQDLRDALMGLTARQRGCVVLHYYLDMSVLEISAQFGLRPGTVKRHLHEARGRLADYLKSPDHAPEDGYAIT